jgi:hypothetical protein
MILSIRGGEGGLIEPRQIIFELALVCEDEVDPGLRQKFLI